MSLTGITYDLLTFDGYGNFGKFDRCFTKAAQFLSLKLDEELRRRLRNRAFFYLRVNGYLDIHYLRSKTEWTIAPATLVQRGEKDFVLIGSSKEHTSIRHYVSNSKLNQIKSNENEQAMPSGLSFYPYVTQLTITADEAQVIARKIGVSLSLFYQDKLFEHLPTLQSVFESVITKADGGANFESDSTKKFNFNKFQWEPYDATSPPTGFFRNEFKYISPEYFIVASTKRKFLEVFRVTEREWAFVCALAKLQIKLPIRYQTENQKLAISRKFSEFRIPNLLERCLRSGTLLAPEIKHEWSIYSSISYRNLWRLIAKLPIFKLEIL